MRKSGFVVLIIFLEAKGVLKALEINNVALRQPTKQQPLIGIVDEHDWFWPSSNAVDGQKECETINGTTLSLSGYSYFPWWQVDLGALYDISKIIVYGRGDGNSREQLRGFSVYLTSEEMSNTIKLKPDYNDTNFDAAVYVLNITKRARYCKLIIPPVYKNTVRPIVLCEVEIWGKPSNLLQSPIIKIAEVQSSELVNPYAWNASNVIDGSLRQDLDDCDCCAAMNSTGTNWIQIDVKRHVLIKYIQVLGRTDGGWAEWDQSSPLLIKVGNTSSFETVYIGSPNDGVGKYWIELSRPRLLQIVRIEHSFSNIMTVCEVLLYDTDCPLGAFGDMCSSLCHCADKQHCNTSTGRCHDPICDDGWKGFACNEECEPGSFGNNCLSECHCLHGPCDPKRGTCKSELCESGWTGPTCSKPCENNTFGTNCSHECHCLDGSCNPFGGVCANDDCDPGWRGPTCSEKIKNLLMSNELNLSTAMSTTKSIFTAEKAVDGKDGPDPETCDCCSTTENSAISWWRVDMGGMYPVKEVMVYGRKDEMVIRQLGGFQMLLSNSSKDEGMVVFNGEKTDSNYTYRVKLSNILSRYITIQRNGILTLCEIIVEEGECIVGRFGKDCSKLCHCADGHLCDRLSGLCKSPICDIGWKGIACNETCTPGWFGLHCREKCQCKNDALCTYDYGVCPEGRSLGCTMPKCNVNGKADEKEGKSNFNASSFGLLVGLVAASTLLLIAVIVIGVICVKNRRDTGNQYDKANKRENHSEYYDAIREINMASTGPTERGSAIYVNETAITS